MSDINQAALLEIIAGKTRSNTAAAILSNTTDLEEAYVQALEAEGSALEENEKYLDSIQGRIDLFTNSVQTMWNNTLDDAWVKGIVNIGTELIKIIDKIGLIKSLLIALSAYSMIKNKMGPIAFLTGISDGILNIANRAKSFIGGLTGMSAATSTYTAQTLSASVANSTLTASEAARLATENGLTMSTTRLNAAEAVNMLTKSGMAQAEALAIVAKLGLGKATEELSKKTLAATMHNMGYTPSAIAAAQASLFGAGATTTLAASFTALWAALWPILALMAGVAVIYGVVKLFDALHVSAEEASETLQETKNSISNLESELESLQTELDETRERIAELEAMPSLSLVEQEELDKLKEQVALLERQQKLKELQLASEEAQLITDAEDVIEKKWNKSGAYDLTNDGVIQKDRWFTWGNSGQDVIDRAIEEYEKDAAEIADLEDALLNWDPAKKGFAITRSETEQALQEAKDRQTERASAINEFFADPDYAGLSYGMSDDIDAFLDEYNQAQLKWEKALYGQASKSNGIQSLFGTNATEEMKALEEEINDIMATDDDWDKKNNAIMKHLGTIDETTEGYEQLKFVMDELDVSRQDIADYFTLQNGEFNSDTVEGVAAQYAKAVDVMQSLKNMNSDNSFTIDGNQYNWDEFFSTDDNNKFEARADKFAEILKGMDDECRQTFMSLAESVKNGEKNWNEAISSFNLSGLIAATKVLENQWEEVNKNVFKSVDDGAISGWIDTFGELSTALEDVASSMDLLHTAQTQMNKSGRISVKTALELIESTDQWDQMLTITEGTIRLNANAEDVLVQSKLNVIKAQIDEALGAVELQLAQLGAADSAYTVAIASDVSDEAYEQYTNAMNSYSASIAAFGAALDAIMSGNWGGALDAFYSTYDTAKKIANSTADTSRINRSELEKKQRDLQAQKNMLSQVGTVSSFKNNYDYDETPGDKYDDDSDKDDAFQKAMDYWENRIGANQARYEQLQNEIDLLEKQGKIAGKEYYQEQIELENERLALLQAQKAEALRFLGTFKEGSEEWWEAANTLNEIEGEIDDVTASVQDLSDAMAEVDWYIFDETHERFGGLIDDLETVRDLLAPNGEEDWFDDEGMWTEEGTAVLATHIQQLEMYKNALDEVNQKLNDYNKAYAGNEEYYKNLGIDSEQELYDAREKLLEQQQDYAVAISESEQAVVDMYEAQIDAIEEYTDELVDSYNDYIDVVREALDAERDLYEFKRSIEEKSTNISDLERRISSLSGSTDDSDIAERRKLEAELADARKDLNDAYYDHANDSLNDALNNESEAYEEAMNEYIKGLRETLDTATEDMTVFLEGIVGVLMLNASTIETQYQSTGLTMDSALTEPWVHAAEAVRGYEDDALALMNTWTQEGGYFANFKNNATSQLKSPWSAGTSAANTFKSDVSKAMDEVVKKIKSNVATSKAELSSLYSQIQDTSKKASSAGTSSSSNSIKTTTPGGGNTVTKIGTAQGVTGRTSGGATKTVNGTSYTQVDGVWYKTSDTWYDKTTKTYNVYKGASAYSINGSKASSQFAKHTSLIGPRSGQIYKTPDAVIAQDNITGLWYVAWGGTGSGASRSYWVQSYQGTKSSAEAIRDDLKSTRGWSPGRNYDAYLKKYAKGTMGTKQDEYAITDEPWLGDELTMYATKQGTLSYMRAGSTVVPADLTKELIDMGELGVDGLKSMASPVSGINLMANYISKPELNLSFDALVKAENITEETLPAVKKLVNQELENFARKLNYSIKKFSK